MAVDTADKRSSAINLSCPWRGLLPLPGTIDQPDRQHVAFMYRGISAGAPPIPVVVGTHWRGSLNGYVLNGMEIDASVPFLFPAPGLPIKSIVKPEDRSMLVAAENRNMIVLRHD